MKLTRLTDEQQHILKLVVEEYYVALPAALKVHSLFATHILSQTLQHYKIRTRVIPCRLWSSLNPKFEFTGGFVNFTNVEKWNGHVVCLAGEWLVDAALYHLNPTYNYEVPKIIARRISMPERGTYTRYRMNKNVEFVWYRLPPQVPLVPLTGYEDYIDRFTSKLIAHINRLLGIVEEPVEDLSADVAGTDATEEIGDDTVADEASSALDGVQPAEFSEGDWQATALDAWQDTETGAEATEAIEAADVNESPEDNTEAATEDTATGAAEDSEVSELEGAASEAFSEGDWQPPATEDWHDVEFASEASEEVAEVTAMDGQESVAGEPAIRSESIHALAEASSAEEVSAAEQALEESAQPA